MEDSALSSTPVIAAIAGEVTLLLQRWTAGDSEACERVISVLQPELKRIAEVRMRSERPDHTLQPTALVNEFFLSLARREDVIWQNRAHFLAVASRAMRRILIDHARQHASGKRGGGQIVFQIGELDFPARPEGIEVLELNELLEVLAARDARMSQVAELRCFGGLTHAEIGDTLGIDERTAKRDWKVARAWLYGQLRKGEKEHVKRGMGEG